MTTNSDIYNKYCHTRPTLYNVEDILGKESTGITTKQYYINHTNINLTIVTRDGLKQEIKHTVSKYTEEFLIRTEYFIPAANVDKVQDFLIRTDNTDDLCIDINAFKEAFFIQYEHSRFKNMRIVIDCVVDQNDIREYRHLYVSNRDLVLSMDPAECAPDHPFSKKALLQERYKELTNNACGVGFSIDIVDNKGDFAPRYLFAAKRLFKIHPFEDKTRESGVYLGVTDFDSSGKLVVETIHLALEEACDRIGLYKTREEAISAGDIKALRSEELSKLSHEISLKNLELQCLLQENKEYHEKLKAQTIEKEFYVKQATLQLEEKLKRIEQENKLMEAELQKWKAKYDKQKLELEDYYSRKQYERKDNSDWFKFVSGVVMGVLGLATFFFKFKKA